MVIRALVLPPESIKIFLLQLNPAKYAVADIVYSYILKLVAPEITSDLATLINYLLSDLVSCAIIGVRLSLLVCRFELRV